MKAIITYELREFGGIRTGAIAHQVIENVGVPIGKFIQVIYKRKGYVMDILDNDQPELCTISIDDNDGVAFTFGDRRVIGDDTNISLSVWRNQLTINTTNKGASELQLPDDKIVYGSPYLDFKLESNIYSNIIKGISEDEWVDIISNERNDSQLMVNRKMGEQDTYPITILNTTDGTFGTIYSFCERYYPTLALNLNDEGTAMQLMWGDIEEIAVAGTDLPIDIASVVSGAGFAIVVVKNRNTENDTSIEGAAQVDDKYIPKDMVGFGSGIVRCDISYRDGKHERWVRLPDTDPISLVRQLPKSEGMPPIITEESLDDILDDRIDKIVKLDIRRRVDAVNGLYGEYVTLYDNCGLVHMVAHRHDGVLYIIYDSTAQYQEVGVFCTIMCESDFLEKIHESYNDFTIEMTVPISF